MKVRALAGISGPFGSHSAGDEFEVAAALGKELIERKLVEAVTAPTKPQAESPAAKE